MAAKQQKQQLLWQRLAEAKAICCTHSDTHAHWQTSYKNCICEKRQLNALGSLLWKMDLLQKISVISFVTLGRSSTNLWRLCSRGALPFLTMSEWVLLTCSSFKNVTVDWPKCQWITHSDCRLWCKFNKFSIATNRQTMAAGNHCCLS